MLVVCLSRRGLPERHASLPLLQAFLSSQKTRISLSLSFLSEWVFVPLSLQTVFLSGRGGQRRTTTTLCRSLQSSVLVLAAMKPTLRISRAICALTNKHGRFSSPPLALFLVLLGLPHLCLASQDDSAAATPRSKSQMPRVSLQDRLLAALDSAELPKPQKRAPSSKSGQGGLAKTQQQQQQAANGAAAAAAMGSVGCFPSIKCIGGGEAGPSATRAPVADAAGGGGGLSNEAIRGDVRRAILADVKLRSDVRKALLDQAGVGFGVGVGVRAGGGGEEEME